MNIILLGSRWTPRHSSRRYLDLRNMYISLCCHEVFGCYYGTTYYNNYSYIPSNSKILKISIHFSVDKDIKRCACMCQHFQVIKRTHDNMSLTASLQVNYQVLSFPLTPGHVHQLECETWIERWRRATGICDGNTMDGISGFR